MTRFTRTSNWKSLLPLLGLACAIVGCAGPAETVNVPQPEKLSAIVDFSTCNKPMYPRADLAAGHQGRVTLRYRVEATGIASESQVAKSSGYPALDESARLAIAKCRFKPPLVDGKPVASWTHVMYIWTIG
jgi:D-alanyl-D-alanine endopeptidase (penicillin-binding protein 7)